MTDNKIIKRIHLIETLFQERQLINMDGVELLNLANRFQKIENDFQQSSPSNFVSKRIAIISSSTSYYFKQVLRLFLYQEGVIPIFYEAEFNTIFEEILNKSSNLYSFHPDVLLILPDFRDIKEMPKLFSTYDEVIKLVNEQYSTYSNLWQGFTSKLESCQIIQGLFVTPPYRAMGSLEENHIFSPQNYFKLINLEFVRYKPSNVAFIDFDYYASKIGKLDWFDDSQYFQSKQTISFAALGESCNATARLMASYFGRLKKCIVIDLDNTIWGGVIGDDGLNGINLNVNDPEGEAYLSFQQYLIALKERGVILAVCSKNDKKIAQEPFKQHPDMVLKLEDISCFMSNWSDKSTNISAIAHELNIGIDSLVFFDDNPAEREIVRKFLPKVEVIDVPEDPALYILALDGARCFDWLQLTPEDIGRSESYVSNKERNQLQESVVDYDQYLESLQMSASISSVSLGNIPRFTQLINKSNQFNLRTKRYSEAKVESMIQNSERFTLLQVTFQDKYSNYGLISCIILEKKSKSLFINTWVMSCRVLKRGIEYLVLDAIKDVAVNLECDRIVGEYIATAKNSLVKDLYHDLGLDRTKLSFMDDYIFDGNAYVQLVSSDQLKFTHYIKTRYE